MTTTTPSLRTAIYNLKVTITNGDSLPMNMSGRLTGESTDEVLALFQAELEALLEQAVPTQIISNAKGSQVNLSSGLAVPVEVIKHKIGELE